MRVIACECVRACVCAQHATHAKLRAPPCTRPAQASPLPEHTAPSEIQAGARDLRPASPENEEHRRGSSSSSGKSNQVAPEGVHPSVRASTDAESRSNGGEWRALGGGGWPQHMRVRVLAAVLLRSERFYSLPAGG